MSTGYIAENHSYVKTLLHKEEYGIEVKEAVLLRGSHNLLGCSNCVCGYFILDGEITFGGRHYGRETLLWFIGGSEAHVWLDRHVHILYIEGSSGREKEYSLRVYDASEMDWNTAPERGKCFSKYMLKAEEDDIKFQTIVYAEGFTHKMHSHTVMHGFYILEGIMKVQYPDSVRYLGPGEFVYMAPGTESVHVQAEDCDYVKCAMICNGKLDFIVDGVNLRE